MFFPKTFMVLNSDFSYWNNRPKMSDSYSVWDWGKYLVRGTGDLSKDMYDFISRILVSGHLCSLRTVNKCCFTLLILSSMRYTFSGIQAVLSKILYSVIEGKNEVNWDQEWLKFSIRITCVFENRKYFFRFSV